MITPNFNTLAATRRLRDSGVAEPQAEAIVHEIVESQTDLVTKIDLAAGLAELKNTLTIRLGLMMAAMFTLMSIMMGRLMSVALGLI
ncbi:MAG: hypothetical protein ACR2P7_01500 [bacterium]